MNPVAYYQSYHQYFWQWEEEGNVLAVNGGSTIGYRQQVAEILMGLAESGLPPFGSVLLVMIGSNVTMDDSVAKAENILIKTLDALQRGKVAHDEIFIDAFAFLRILNSLPAEYKTGKRKQILLQAIFANCHYRINVAASKAIAKEFLRGYKSRPGNPFQYEFNEPVLLKELRVLALLKRKFPTPDAIIAAMSELPELEDEVAALPDNISVSETSYEDFVEELLQNPRTFEIAALIKPIWAGFNIPIFNAHPSEQPLGGISDISNKGDFDKLLISEFANDDILFMNRVANNEALYLHREMPPVKDDLHRTILIDVSIKSWGTPKVLSLASYIAIARHPKANTQSRAYVLGNDFTPVSCNGADEIIDMLQHTEASLHPGTGLTSFLEENKDDKALEIFYITTSEALKYQQVQKPLADHHTFFKYIITTDAGGSINFYRNKKNSLQLLQTIRLPLERLWTKKITQKPLPPVVIESPPDYIPLLLPVPSGKKRVLPLEPDICYYIANKCLLKHTISFGSKTAKGLELVLRNTPIHCKFEIGKHNDGDVHFLQYNPHNRELCISNLNSLKQAKASFDQWNVKSYPEFLFFHGDSFVILKERHRALNLLPDYVTGAIAVENMELISDDLDTDYWERQSNRSSYPDIYVHITILKKVTRVYINDANCLVLNGHQLYTDNRGMVNFTYPQSTKKIAGSTRNSNKREFVFKDGSKVLVDPLGYIQLVSSDPTIQAIYITATPDSIPGLATNFYFAGSEIYYNENLGKVGVQILNTGINVMSCIKIIRDNTGISLIDIKQVLETAPAYLPCKLDIPVAEHMLKELAKQGCSTVIEKTKQPPQKIISPERFYQENIALFISHIINNETAG